jgi:radical SAM family uncharacterized protein/radical SAM-linked protein
MPVAVPQPHPYASFVHLVQKPARYLGGEFGSAKKDWSAVRARVCLAFPDLYDIGMSHLGFKILYKILNDDDATLAERCYAPWVDMQKELRERKLPLVSLETAHALSEFDVVGFSLQFELTYTNVLLMLDLGGVPLKTSERGESDPLVIAGGPTATHPEPLADFLDAIVIGDGEERTTQVALLWVDLKDKGVARKERLRELARLPGVYVPSLYSTQFDPDTGFDVVAAPSASSGLPFPVRRSLVEDLNKFPFPDDGPVGGPEAIFDRMSIEIARGCTEGCRFCQAGMIYRPVRERDPQQIVDTVVSSIKKSGYDEVSLTSLSTADYSCIAPLIEKVTARLAPERVSLGVSSLRAYGLEESVLDDIQKVRAGGVTFAPEAGSQRMRDVVNKNVTEEQLMTTAERVFSRGWTGMKLYFMIGLPTEEESDVREIVKVGSRAHSVGKRIKREIGGGGAPTVTVSVSTHVPKPHTPFQWCAMDTPDTVVEKQHWLKEEARKTKVTLKMHESEGSWLEAIFARGDRKLSRVLERAYKDGARFDSWDEHLKIDIWERALAAEGIEPAKYLGTIPVTARLPWDHIDVGLEEGFLAREYRKALKSRLSPPCGKVAGAFIHHTNLDDAQADAKKLVCYDCGVACDMGAMREERLVYLTKLGAKSRRVTLAKAAPEPLPPGITPKKKKPPTIVQGEPRRYRFTYTKLGASAFLSHLDLIRALPRAFRRNELPLFYSSGFHPKPDMTFGPALSLGVPSLGEVVDVKLTADLSPADCAYYVGALTSSAPDGLDFTGAVRLGGDDAAVARVIDTARYAVAFPRSVLAGRGGEAWLRARVESVLAAVEIRQVRRIEGIGKAIDVRPFIRRLEVGADAANEAVRASGLLGDLVTILVDVAITGSGSVKISEVVEALGSKEEPLEHRAIRVMVGATRNGELFSTLDLDAIRKPKPVTPPEVVATEGAQAAQPD